MEDITRKQRERERERDKERKEKEAGREGEELRKRERLDKHFLIKESDGIIT